MFIPFERKPDWRHPPLATILLILANLLIFFIFQSGDERRMQDAIRYYFESGLARIELPHYIDAMNRAARYSTTSSTADPTSLDIDVLFQMQYDKTYMERLRDGQIINPRDARYAEWRLERSEFDRLLNRVTSERFGLRPAQVDGPSLLAHMFLHSSVTHLLGNMLFLFAVGFMVEATLGGWFFIVCYIVVGLGSAGLDILCNSDSLVPSIGASGAIAGIMGLYAVLFGLRPVRFFYFVLFYFNYTKAPALILLAVWLGWEIYQYVALSDVSDVDYLAHIGGLVSGALIGLAFIKLRPSLINTNYLDQSEWVDRYQETLHQAEAYMKELEFRRARPLLKTLHRTHPHDRRVLYQFYQACQEEPAGEDYHEACLKILNLTERDPATERLIADVAEAYLKRAQPRPRLTPLQIEQLAGRLLASGHIAPAERLVRVMLSNPTHFTELPIMLNRLINAYRSHQPDKARIYQELLHTHFSDVATTVRLPLNKNS